MKRLFEIFISLFATFILLPVFLIIAIMIKIDSHGPVFFCQRRIGKNDKEFLMYKFRTMAVGTPEVATDKLLNSNFYITKIGYYLRKYSLDELPQILNILLGQMSIVGPRPALYNQYELRSMRNELGINSINPGLTGWAQINGRDDISEDKKVELDLFYLKNQSMVFDLKIILLTVFSLSDGTGITKEVKSNNYPTKRKYL